MISHPLPFPKARSLFSRAALGYHLQRWLRSSMVAGRGRDVLGEAAGEAAAGKMADGKAGEEKPEKPQRAGAAGGEHNPSVAGCVGCCGPFFELPSASHRGVAFQELAAGRVSDGAGLSVTPRS